MAHGHAGDAQLQHSCFQGLKLGFLADDLHLGELGGGAVGSVEGGDTLDGNGLGGGHTASDGHGGVGLHGGGIRQHGEAGIGGKQAVLGDIQTGDLFLRRDPQADGVLQDGEDDGDDHSHIEDYGSNAQALDAKEVEATAVKDPLFRGHAGGEEAGEDSAQGTADAMDRDGAHRVVNLGNLVEKLHGQHDDQTEDDAHNGGTQRGYSVTPGADDQLVGVHAYGGGTVEAEPAEPENEHAQSGKGQVVA